jgi:hypothetical protein
VSFASFKLAIFLIWSLIVASGAGWAVHKIDLASYQKLELRYASAQAQAVAQAKAEQARLDEISRAAAQQEIINQRALTENARARLEEVQKHVAALSRDRARQPGCVTLGFVRLLDASVHGVATSSLKLPARGTDADCAPLTPAAVASAILGNYATAIANAEQLNALIDASRKLTAEQKK